MRILVCKAYKLYCFCILPPMPCFELWIQVTLDWRIANMTLRSPPISGHNNSYFIASQYIKAKKTQNKIKKPPAKCRSWGCAKARSYNIGVFFQTFTQALLSKHYPPSSPMYHCTHVELSASDSTLHSTGGSLYKSFNCQENSFKKCGLDCAVLSETSNQTPFVEIWND